MAAFTAQEMRALSTNSREVTRESEEADFNAHLARWKKRQQEKARAAIAFLPQGLKAAAEKGKYEMILRVETGPPYTFNGNYRVFRLPHQFSRVEFGTCLTLTKCRDLPEASRPIALWLLRNGFQVMVYGWAWNWLGERECDLVRRYTIHDVAAFLDKVIPANEEASSLFLVEGLRISW